MKKIKTKKAKLSLLTFVALLAGIFITIIPHAYAPSAQFTNDQDMYFTGSSSDPGTVYQDAIDGNQDIGIQLCDVGQRYVGAFYALNAGGSWVYELVSYNSFSNALALTDSDVGGGCYEVTEGFLTISPSELTTPDPDIRKAAFPGKVYIGYATSANPGTVSDFVFGGSNAQLLGDYSFTRSFDESTRQVTIQTPTISFQTSSGSFAKTASDSDFGISGDRRLVIGFCDDTDGLSCNAGSVFSSSSFPAIFNTGLTAGQVNDQNTYTKYVVINGLGKQMCIGSNLKTSISSVNPSPVYYSQNLVINYTITNPLDTPDENEGGNVGVTSSFDVRVTIYNSSQSSQIVYSSTETVTDDVASSGSVSKSITWPANAPSGSYTAKIEVDVNSDITECNEADNSDTENFQLLPVTIPEVYIDGTQTDFFAYPNAPYNLSFHFKNSDNQTLRNANITLIEQNGLVISAPTQIYNRSTGVASTEKDGIKAQTRIDFQTDYSGNSSFTFIPTYNKLYSPQYNYTELADYIGSYSLYFQGVDESGSNLAFIENGVLTTIYELNITNTSYSGSFAGKGIANEQMVSQVMDLVYQTFSNFLQTLLS